MRVSTTELTPLGISGFARFVIVPSDKDLVHTLYTYFHSLFLVYNRKGCASQGEGVKLGEVERTPCARSGSIKYERH